MIEFKHGVLYPLDEIEKHLGDTMTLKTFLSVLGLEPTGKGRMFQKALLGDEILRAIQRSTESGELQQSQPAPNVDLPRPKPPKATVQPVTKWQGIKNSELDVR